MQGSKLSRQYTAAVLTLLLGACNSVNPPTGTVEVQLLAINDLHGNLETPTSGLPPVLPAPADGPHDIPSGGIARLATLIKQRRASHQYSMLVAAGDLIGGSPLLSSRFHDEPTVQALSAIGLQLSAVGNHEFDEGAAELRRMQNGGCHPQTGCQGPTPYAGAGYNYLAANVIDERTGETLFPATAVREFGGVRVGFIGLTLESTPSLLIPSSRTGLQFLDEAATINQQVAKLRNEGIESIVVLIHEGGSTVNGPGDCASLSGTITTILPQLDDAVDVVISGHTHRAYQCNVDGVLLTSAGQYGTQLSDISITLDRASGDVVSTSAETLVVATAIVAEDPAIAALVDTYRTLAEPMMQREIGIVTTALTRDRNDAGESVLGDVVADAMLATTELNTGENVDIAFMNPGGLRLDIANTSPVRFADLFAAQPFGNTLVVLTLTGSGIEAVLQQQFDSKEALILQVSDGFRYRWQRRGGTMEVVTGSITINGEPLQADRRYRIATNNFLAEGGDGFTAFAAATDPTPAGGDVEALEAYLSSHSPFTPPPIGRITLEPTR